MEEVELIVTGDVLGVGYRQYVAKIGRKLKLVGFVENLKDGTVLIHCRGEEKNIAEFKRQINTKKPEFAPLIDVEEMKVKQLASGTIKQTIFEEVYGDAVAEMSQGFSTGMNYMNLFREENQKNLNRSTVEIKDAINHSGVEIKDAINHSSVEIKETINRSGEEAQKNLNLFRVETQENLGLLRTDTQASFKHMDEKYDAITQAMLAVVNSIEERNRVFESRMEKTDKNIESLLMVLSQKKG